MKISLWRCHAVTIADGALSHKIDYLTIFNEILNPEEHPNCITGSKVTAILVNWWILPIGGASLGRVCACSDDKTSTTNFLVPFGPIIKIKKKKNPPFFLRRVTF